MMPSDRYADPASAMQNIELALRGVNLRALGLDHEQLLLRATWWPSRGPGVAAADKKLDEERSKARLLPGVWIYGETSAPVECTSEVIGATADDRWAASMLQMLIERNAP